jgi:hypothetical protein
MAEVDHVHCFHRTGLTLMSNPPLTVKVCCHCGHEINERAVFFNIPESTHGPYFPKGCYTTQEPPK